jgi:hypothetical protein
VLAEIRALRSSIFKSSPEVQRAIAIADKIEQSYDCSAPTCSFPRSRRSCRPRTVHDDHLTGTMRRVGWIFRSMSPSWGFPREAREGAAMDISASRSRSGDLRRLHHACWHAGALCRGRRVRRSSPTRVRTLPAAMGVFSVPEVDRPDRERARGERNVQGGKVHLRLRAHRRLARGARLAACRTAPACPGALGEPTSTTHDRGRPSAPGFRSTALSIHRLARHWELSIW